MGVVREKENLIAPNRNATVGAEFRVTEHPGAGWARIVPKRTACQSVEGEDLVRACYIKDSIRGERCGFEAKVLNGENPFQLQRGHIRGTDLFEQAVAIPRVISVVTEPVAGLRRTPGNFARRLGRGHG